MELKRYVMVTGQSPHWEGKIRELLFSDYFTSDAILFEVLTNGLMTAISVLVEVRK